MRPQSGNFGELFHEAVRRVPDQIALIAEGVSVSYRELERRTNRAANLFRSYGVGQGDRVALLFPNDYRFIEICFGLMRIGAVPLPLNMKLDTGALSYIVTDSGAKLLVYHESLADKAVHVKSPHVTEPRVFVGDQPMNQEGGFPAAIDYEKEASRMPDELTVERMKDDDLCFLLYTSGSTGRPKGCMLTHGGQWWNTEANCEALGIGSGDRSLVSVPLYHKNAMINAVKPCLFKGASLVILPGFQPEDVVRAIERYEVTYTTGVPAMYKMILAYCKEYPGHRLPSLKFLVCGSSEVPEELKLELQDTFQAEILEAYGLTEGGPQVLASPRSVPGRQGSSGLPVPGCEVRAVSTDGEERPLPPGEIGELWVRSPGVAKGYWNLPEATRKRITPDGWLKTGDLVRFDRDGYGYIIGRQDDMINIGGEKAYPKEIENILSLHPDIADVCVIGMTYDMKGYAPAAFVVKRPGSALSEREVKDFFLERGPAYAHPRKVLFLERLPLSGTGKVDKAALKTLLQTVQR
ncbi:Long-chain-fatty-acid--CoA ligase [Paenibacillus sp. CECT 9249]|uniref:class I adenylate-forming enzyme family protein n=1 Tax=Paenibacillus sp. CECT 9249 TaxID=2845385 RepID=UPI001E5371ED|nr:class I adenylate-forming enzyme family protein [Paenibacillus sp. CECT 9249]CAH0120007.1 Long-chain-fatty-acid--CoA ligase [Paenibacillus sp. CECT 9249]